MKEAPMKAAIGTLPSKQMVAGVRRREDVIWLAALLVGLAFCFLVDEPVYQWVHEHYNINTRPVPVHLKLTTRILRSMEDWGENIYILAVAVAMWRLDRRRRSRILCLVIASGMIALGVEGIKRATGRERPEVGSGRWAFHGPARWLQGGDVQSFPSGHTAAAAGYSGALAAFYPPIRPVAIALAVGCGGNRIWKERHFLSDCWMGGLLGFWFATTLPRRRWIQPLLERFDARFSDRAPELTDDEAAWRFARYWAKVDPAGRESKPTPNPIEV
jgi:membrane-associated phospholipid phosphatase